VETAAVGDCKEFDPLVEDATDAALTAVGRDVWIVAGRRCLRRLFLDVPHHQSHEDRHPERQQ
jgi:hypothetical protein